MGRYLGSLCLGWSHPPIVLSLCGLRPSLASHKSPLAGIFSFSKRKILGEIPFWGGGIISLVSEIERCVSLEYLQSYEAGYRS